MWFDAQMTGLLGAVLGSVAGVCGGILGVMAGVFARKGKFKKLVLTFAAALIAFGAMSLSAGIIALMMQQPYHVWYLFMIPGGILVAALLPNYFNIKKVYARAELSKMSATDNNLTK
jgi:uncharacterized membrane protein YfcA